MPVKSCRSTTNENERNNGTVFSFMFLSKNLNTNAFFMSLCMFIAKIHDAYSFVHGIRRIKSTNGTCHSGNEEAISRAWPIWCSMMHQRCDAAYLDASQSWSNDSPTKAFRSLNRYHDIKIEKESWHIRSCFTRENGNLKTCDLHHILMDTYWHR